MLKTYQKKKLTKMSRKSRKRELFPLNLVSLDLVSFPNLVSLFFSSENEIRLTGRLTGIYDIGGKSLDYKKKDDEK